MKANLSAIIPVYNEQGNILELYKRLKPVLEKEDKNHELIFVNDASKDKTHLLIKELHSRDPRVKLINLSRNFGQQAAVTAGLEVCTGEVVVTMDADLQDPPEVLPDFFAKLKEGFNVAYSISVKRSDPPFRRFLFDSYYFVMDKLSPVKFPRNAGIFAVMDRQVVDTLLTISERNRFVPALRTWIGYKQIGIPFEKPKRFSGEESQSITKLFKMGFDSLFSFSYVPLRLATFLGLIVSLGAFIAILQVLYQKLIAGTAILGWSSPLIATLFIGGVELVILGIVGEYLGRIYDEVKRRPYYVISEKIGF